MSSIYQIKAVGYDGYSSLYQDFNEAGGDPKLYWANAGDYTSPVTITAWIDITNFNWTSGGNLLDTYYLAVEDWGNSSGEAALYVYIGQNATATYFTFDRGYGAQAVEQQVTFDHWYNITWYLWYDVGAVELNGHLYVDDVLTIDYNDIPRNFDIVSVYFGKVNSGAGSGNMTIYYDDIIIDGGAISVSDTFEGVNANLNTDTNGWSIDVADYPRGLWTSEEESHSSSHSLKLGKDWVYSDNWELGEKALFWDVSGGDPYTVTSNASYVHTGTYGLQPDTAGGFWFHRLDYRNVTTSVYSKPSPYNVSFYWKIVPNGTAPPTASGSSRLAFFELQEPFASAWWSQIYVVTDPSWSSPHLRWQDDIANYVNGTTDLNSNQWYEITLSINYTTSDYTTEVYVDDVLETTYTNTNPLGVGDYHLKYFYVEQVYWTLGYNCMTALDDLTESDVNPAETPPVSTTYQHSFSVYPSAINNAEVTYNATTQTMPYLLNVSDADTYVINATQTLAYLGDTYAFDSWLVNGTTGYSNTTLTFFLDGNSTFQANYFVTYSISGTILYFRSDSHTINNVTGFKLMTTNTNSVNDLNETSVSSGLNASWGFRVFIRGLNGTSTELTSGTQIGLITRTVDGSGYLFSSWTCPTTLLVVGFDSIEVRVYTKMGAGSWVQKASFITETLLYKRILTSSWVFYVEVWKSTGSTVSTFEHGEHDSANSLVAGLSFQDASEFELMLFHLQSGNLFTFIMFPYTYLLIGGTFYGLLLLLLCVPVYIKYRDLDIIIFMLILFGGSGGFFSLLMPASGLQIGFFVMAFGLGALIYRVFTSRQG